VNSNVAVLGASGNPERYSNKAVRMLLEHKYNVFPVHPSGKPVADIPCYTSLSEIGEELDTVSVYLSEKNSTPLIDEILKVHPRRIILNPGAENAELRKMRVLRH
jgi:predicted CoA-binding protein